MRIEVTAMHIKQGAQDSPVCCPVTLAMRDAGFLFACTTESEFLCVGDEAIEIPLQVLEWLARYDATGAGEPFAFNLEVAGLIQEKR